MCTWICSDDVTHDLASTFSVTPSNDTWTGGGWAQMVWEEQCTDNLLHRSPRSCVGLHKWSVMRRAQEGPLKVTDRRCSLNRKENWQNYFSFGIQADVSHTLMVMTCSPTPSCCLTCFVCTSIMGPMTWVVGQIDVSHDLQSAQSVFKCDQCKVSAVQRPYQGLLNWIKLVISNFQIT